MNLLFDLDGTLTDPFEGITRCIAYALTQLGRKPPSRKTLRWCIGPPLKDSFSKLLATDDAGLVQKAVDLYRQRFGSVGMFENRVYPAIPKVLVALKAQGNHLVVATSKPTVYAAQIVDHFDLRPFFEAVYGSDLDGTRSDKTGLISHILEKASLAHSRTWMIGDRKHDIQGAVANRIKGLGVLWGYGSRNELETAGAHACIRFAEELPAFFAGRVEQAKIVRDGDD